MSGRRLSLFFVPVRIAVLAVLLQTSFLAAAEQPGIVLREFIYNEAPFPECHASTIEETPGGLVAAWFGGT